MFELNGLSRNVKLFHYMIFYSPPCHSNTLLFYLFNLWNTKDMIGAMSKHLFAIHSF